MGPQTILTTRRLRLRQWRRSDLTLYARHCNTAAVMEWLGGVMTPRGLRQEYDYFQRQQRRNGFTFWVMERKSDKALLGFCGLVRVTERSSTVLGEVEIGWRVRSDMWRRGYAYEAAQAVLRYAFTELCISAVVSRAAAGNEASQALMHKLGMRRAPNLDYIYPSDRTLLCVYVITRDECLRLEQRLGDR
jgi:RimJ/RimL family protein N-acetyltransferase